MLTIVDYLQILKVLTNVQFYYHVFQFLVNRYMYLPNCHHQGTDTMLLKLTAIKESAMVTYIKCLLLLLQALNFLND